MSDVIIITSQLLCHLHIRVKVCAKFQNHVKFAIMFFLDNRSREEGEEKKRTKTIGVTG